MKTEAKVNLSDIQVGSLVEYQLLDEAKSNGVIVSRIHHRWNGSVIVRGFEVPESGIVTANEVSVFFTQHTKIISVESAE